MAHSHSLSLLYLPFIAAEELWSRNEKNEVLLHEAEQNLGSQPEGDSIQQIAAECTGNVCSALKNHRIIE